MEDKKASWFPLLVIMSSMIMMYITSFSINVLIAPIVHDLSWSVSGLQLMIVAASLISGTLQVTAGRLGDKLGKKKIFTLGSIIYTIGLLMVVLAPNSTIFSIAWALVWPLGMVLVIPTSVALIMYFYKGAQRAAAFGIYGAVLSVVSAIAPLVVGALSNVVGWRIALALSPVFGVLTILMAFALPETSKDENIKIDIPSVILSVVSFGLFLISTTMAGRYGWFMEKRPFMLGGSEISLGGFSIVPILYAVSIVLLLMFFKRGQMLSSRGEEPLLVGHILKDVTFSIGMAISAILFLLIAAILFVVSVFVQSSAGFDALSTALATLPASAGTAVFSFFTPGLSRKVPVKWIMITGFGIILVGLFILSGAASVEATPLSLMPGMLLFGIGSGLVMAQVASVTMKNIRPEDEGGASGLSETMKEIIGQGFAVAFAGAIMFGAVYSNMVDGYEAIEGIDLTAAQEAEIVIELENTFQEITPLKEQEFIQSLPEKTQSAYAEIVNTAAEQGFSKTLGVIGIFAAAAMVLALFLPPFKLEAE